MPATAMLGFEPLLELLCIIFLSSNAPRIPRIDLLNFQPSKSTHFAATVPSPYNAGREDGGVKVWTASKILSRLDPARRFQPASTVSTHSVSSRNVMHGTPSQ